LRVLIGQSTNVSGAIANKSFCFDAFPKNDWANLVSKLTKIQKIVARKLIKTNERV
jgi:hypothetical protein